MSGSRRLLKYAGQEPTVWEKYLKDLKDSMRPLRAGDKVYN